MSVGGGTPFCFYTGGAPLDIRGKGKRSFWLSLLFFLCIFLWPQTVYAEKTSKNVVLTIETAVMSSTSEEETFLPLKLELSDADKNKVELENKRASITLAEWQAGVCVFSSEPTSNEPSPILFPVLGS